MCRYPLITVDWMRSHLGRMNKIRRCPPSLSETGVVAEALLFFVIYTCVMQFSIPVQFYGCIFWTSRSLNNMFFFFARLCKSRERLMLFHMKRGVSPQGKSIYIWVFDAKIRRFPLVFSSFRVDFHDFPVPNSEPMESLKTSAGEEIPSAAPQWIELQNPWPDLKTNPCAGWCFGTMELTFKKKMGTENHPNWGDGW